MSCCCNAPPSHRDAAVTAQDALLVSLNTLLELHNICLPPPKTPKRRVYDPPPTLERFSNLRAVTVSFCYKNTTWKFFGLKTNGVSQ